MILNSYSYLSTIAPSCVGDVVIPRLEKEQVKICFLDFDGVITATHRAFLAGMDYDPIAASILNRALKEGGYKIVVSSTWRLGEPRLTLWTYLKLMGITVGLHEDYKTTEVHNRIRGNQIKEWLSHHPEVDDYIIIDDDCDMLEEQMSRFIHCDGAEGFGAKDYKKMKEMWVISS